MNGILLPNDVILQMGDLPIATINDLINARQGSQSKKTAVLMLFRNQREQKVTINLK
jgi:S1-C subfamily serine protease